MPYFELEIKTPIHIGNGETWNSFTDFISIGKEMYLLDSDKIFNTLLEYKPIKKEKNVLKNKKITSFAELNNIENPKTPIDEYLDIVRGNGNNKGDIKGILRDYFNQTNIENSLTEDFIKEYTKGQYNIEKSDNNVDIEKFIKSGNRAYIPGSSLKGAIKTALIYKENECNKGGTLNVDPFGKFANDEFKYLQVGDSSFIGKESMSIEAILINYIYSGNQDGTPIMSECISIGNLKFRLKTTGINTRFNFLKKENETSLLKEVDSFYRGRLQKEIKIFEELKKEKSFKYDNILNNYRNLFSSLKEDEYLIRLGKHKVDYDQTLLELMDEKEALKIVNRKKRKEKLTSMKDYPITRKMIIDNKNRAINTCGWATIKKVGE